MQYGPTFLPVFAANLPYCSANFGVQSRCVLFLLVRLAFEGIRCADNSTELVTGKARCSRHSVQLRGGGRGCACPDSICSLSEVSDLPRSVGIAAQPCLDVLLSRMPSPPAYQQRGSSLRRPLRSRTWAAEYLNSVKPRTVESYKANIKQHIKPAVGTLHKALEKAVSLGYIRHNPADKPDLPKVQKAEIKPLADDEMISFLDVVKGCEYEVVYVTTLFTGMREGEVLGLTWDCIDIKGGTITIKQQLQKVRATGGEYILAPTKNGKTRIIAPASYVMQILTNQRKTQYEQRLKAGHAWSNPLNLVFTNAFGRNLCAQTVYLHFKKLAAAAGVPATRFHDLRHSYAVAALRSGDDIKTVQENLGHHTAAFTLDTYAHVTEKMRQESARLMDSFIEGIQAAKKA